MNWYKTFFSLLICAAAYAAMPLMGMDALAKYNYWNFIETLASREAFLAQHSVSAEHKKILDKNLPPLDTILNPQSKRPGIAEFPWLVDHVVKFDRDDYVQTRVPGSLLIRKCACENNLDAVSAPVKQFYTRTVQGHTELYVIAQKITAINKPFSLKQIQQLWTLSKITNYTDLHPGNILNTAAGVVYIVDTEPQSFCDRIFPFWNILINLPLEPGVIEQIVRPQLVAKL